MGPELDWLRLLVAVEEHGSLGAAARNLGISQPAASARLRAMEARYSINLVQRSARGSQLTAEGVAVSSWARAVLDDVEVLENGLQSLSERHRGTLSIAASLTIAEYLVPQWLAELRTQRPDVTVGLTVVNSDEVVRALREHTARIGFIEGDVDLNDLHSRVIGRDEVGVVASPQHLWATRKSPISAAELADTPLVLRERGSGTRSTFERQLGSEPKVALQASATHAVLNAAASGVAPAVVSLIAAQQHLTAGTLRAIPTTLRLVRPLRAVWAPTQRLRPPVTDLLQIAMKS